jgi:hypothetical protein
LVTFNLEGGTSATVGAITAGTAGPVTLSAPAKGGEADIRVVTSECTAIEKTKVEVRLNRAHLEVPDHCERKKPCRIHAEHYPPNSDVTFTAVRGGSTMVQHGHTEGAGDADVAFQFPDRYAWAIVGAVSGEAHTWWVQVD